MDVGVRSALDRRALVEAIKRELHAVDPDVPISHVQTLSEAVSQSIAPRRLNLSLVGGFAAVALVLCLVGVYGVMNYAVTERTREIGIRLALGADPKRVLAMVLADGLRLVAIGTAAGLTTALFVARLLASLLYDVRPGDPATFTAVPLMLIGAAIAASYPPARRAMRMDPVIVLRRD
jgi:ABC-type antimicrobial peptide transport system permease subunit